MDSGCTYDTLVWLFSLNMAMQIIRHKTPGIAIVDLYFMRDVIFKTHDDVLMATDYLSSFLETNSDKDVILIPYHPVSESDRQGCVLIQLDVKHSSALYLDSGSATRKTTPLSRKFLMVLSPATSQREASSLVGQLRSTACTCSAT